MSAEGRHVSELETPAAVVDLDRLERNLARAAAYAERHALALYPHVKTHKTLEIAQRQLAAGASGLTVAKTSEAEILVGAGLRSALLLHYPVVGAEKVARLAALAEHGPIAVAVDSLAAAEPIAAALARRGLEADALIELDVGMRRTGVAPEDALALAEDVERLGGGLRVAGLSCYPGHLRGLDEDALAAALADVDAILGAAQALLTRAGISCERVSAGSTATLFASHRTRATELRPGNYALLDRAEAYGVFSEDDCALRVHATVVSTSVPGRLALDAGSKALSEAPPPPGSVGYGSVAGREDIVLERLSEEHAHAALAPGAPAPRVGDRVEVTPNHACTCVNLHDVLYGARDGRVETVMAVVARGAIR